MTEREIRPGFDRPLRLGTRSSPLAMVQAKLAAAAIRDVHGWRRDQVELVPVVASGDKVQDRALAEIGGKALWTKELDRALMAHEIDAAVHSMKDVETVRPDALLIGAMLERADPRDRLIGAEALDALPEGATIGTASARRRAQLLNMRSDLNLTLIRGNVQTRLDKVTNGEVDATILAAAGLDRLKMDDVGAPIAEELMLSAPAQGAIGLETHVEHKHIRRLLQAINHRPTFAAVMAERSFLAALKADCHSPVAAYAVSEGEKMWLRAQLLSEDGGEQIRDETEFGGGEVKAAGRLALKMLGKAGRSVRKAFGK